MKIKDFVNRDLKRFSRYDTERSIPHLFDGLKTSQRKILRTALKQGFVLIKCNQLGTKAAEQNVYHHSEDSLINTVIGMARDFPGSNNVPYLQKDGQFGNILSPDSSSPRYISAKLHENAANLFKPEDEPILLHQWEEGRQIEPEFYLPPVPMILVNGGDGRGTGFACKILPHSYVDVAQATAECFLTGKITKRLTPAFEGFKGTITRAHDDQIIMVGCYDIDNATTIRITELPIKWTQDKYKLHLNKLIADKKIKSYTNRSTEDGWDFEIKVPREVTKLSPERIRNMFKLVEKRTQTLVAWTDGIVPEIFNSPEAMIERFCEMRSPFYEKRKQSMLDIENHKFHWAKAKISFIDYWNEHADVVRQNNKADIIKHVSAFLPKLTVEQVEKLVSLPIYSLTAERRAQLLKEAEDIHTRICEIENLTTSKMWRQHLVGKSC